MSTFTGWAIDRDYLADHAEAETGHISDDSRVGYGQRDAVVVENEADTFFARRITVETDLRAADVADPVRFCVLDDDGEVYYGGSISRAWLEGDDYLALAPLTFATADAGATEMQYRDGHAWKTL